MTDVLLSSGGLDSAVIAATHPDAVHLHVYYGQRNAHSERLSSGDVATHYGAEWCTVALTGFAVLAPSTLTGQSGDLTGTPTVVPNRNATLISLGVALALSRGGGTVTGDRGPDAANYGDLMTVSWICGPDMLDHAPEIPIIRAHYQICANRGPQHMRCDRPTGHSGRCYESIWDSSTDGTEIRFAIGVWDDQ